MTSISWRTLNRSRLLFIAAGAISIAYLSCSERTDSVAPLGQTPQAKPSILLVTLDTTRADSIGPEARGVDTPAFNALAGKGRRYRYAYATTPQTLPSHASMMTGLYPAAHGVHENSRYLSANHPLLASKLRASGYRTAAFVSGYPLARQFGLATGFDHYDDAMEGGRSERSAQATTERALQYLQQHKGPPVFLWVHYFDAHHPYQPPQPFRDQYRNAPYLGEIAAMDHELGRLLNAFALKAGQASAVLVVGDHGESLGEHGEAQHGNLLYQGTMRVPLLLVGPGISPAVIDTPVSIRRIFHTILDWAGEGTENSLRSERAEIVAGEAMNPFLNYGWQPQVMAVENGRKVILSGRLEVYDVMTDPAERNDLRSDASVSREMRQTLHDYPVPSPDAAAAAGKLSDESRRRLASLGYISAETKPVVRKDAPRPADMTSLFEILDLASGLFVREDYDRAIPLLNQILSKDPHNLSAALRLAAAHSALGHESKALEAFRIAEAIAPKSDDVKHYLALHHVRSGDWQKAAPLLEAVLVRFPDRLPALEALARIRERQERFGEAVVLLQRIHKMRTPTNGELLHLGALAMRTGNTPLALTSFEEARRIQGSSFENHLELGVLYLDAGRLKEAATALDRVAPREPGYPMALFKRAQVSALLREPDLPARIQLAGKHADTTTRVLIDRERLFRGIR